MATTIASALLYTYEGKAGVTREGAVLAADPFCNQANRVSFARLVFVTDDGIGATEAIHALGFLLEPKKLNPEHEPIYDALLYGKFATAVNLAASAGILK